MTQIFRLIEIILYNTMYIVYMFLLVVAQLLYDSKWHFIYPSLRNKFVNFSAAIQERWLKSLFKIISTNVQTVYDLHDRSFYRYMYIERTYLHTKVSWLYIYIFSLFHYLRFRHCFVFLLYTDFNRSWSTFVHA